MKYSTRFLSLFVISFLVCAGISKAEACTILGSPAGGSPAENGIKCPEYNPKIGKTAGETKTPRRGVERRLAPAGYEIYDQGFQNSTGSGNQVMRGESPTTDRSPSTYQPSASGGHTGLSPAGGIMAVPPVKEPETYHLPNADGNPNAASVFPGTTPNIGGVRAPAPEPEPENTPLPKPLETE